jgi:peroxiredoxin
MEKIMKRVLSALALITFTTLGFTAAEVGKSAPDFSGTDIDGKTHKLSDYKGKIVVLEAQNLDCPYVANHYKSGAMQELQGEMKGKGVVWLIVNSTAKSQSNYRSPEEAKQEWEKRKIQASAWIDDNSGTIGKAYGMRTTPHIFIIDKEGNLAYQGAIDDKAEASGDPRKARNYVREVVQNLEAGQKVELAQTKPYGCGVKYAKN